VGAARLRQQIQDVYAAAAAALGTGAGDDDDDDGAEPREEKDDNGKGHKGPGRRRTAAKRERSAVAASSDEDIDEASAFTAADYARYGNIGGGLVRGPRCPGASGAQRVGWGKGEGGGGGGTAPNGRLTRGRGAPSVRTVVRARKDKLTTTRK
jgi:hypothetical protein